jgi:hypothetical protein
MSVSSECDHLKGRRRAICYGAATGLTLERCNAYRVHWGLSPLDAPLVDTGEQSQPLPLPKLPPLLIRGWNFSQALARWALAGMPRRSQPEIDERLAICQTCEYLKHQHCQKCGCACVETNRLMNKLALATERCPLGKWQ